MLCITSNQDDINDNIYEIFVECLLNEYINIINDDNWLYFSDEDDFDDYLDMGFIPEYFNNSCYNILEKHNKSYTLDYKTIISCIKWIKRWAVDEYGWVGDFNSMFNENVNSETEIINSYAYWFARKTWFDIYEHQINDKWSIIKIYRNIAKYNFHKNKHNKLINLYDIY